MTTTREAGLMAAGAAFMMLAVGAPDAMAGDGCQPELTQVLEQASAQDFDLFGAALAVSGDVLLVGAPGTDDAVACPKGQDTGAVFIYQLAPVNELSDLLATETGQLISDDLNCFDEFGAALALSPAGAPGPLRALVGAPGADGGQGAAYLFEFSKGGFQTFELGPAGGPDDVEFGRSVSLADAPNAGLLALVGAPFETDFKVIGGVVYVFDVDTGALLFELTSDSGDPFGEFGAAVDSDAGVGLIGAPFDNSDGAAYLFDLETGEQLSTLNAIGACIEKNALRFGAAVAIDGAYAAVGAPGDCNAAFDAGAVWIFDISDPVNPVLIQRIDGVGFDEQFGTAVDLDAQTLVVGAPRPFGEQNGTASIFEIDPADNQIAFAAEIDDPAGFSGDLFGAAVVADDARFFSGAPESFTMALTGAAFIHRIWPERYWNNPKGGSWFGPNWGPQNPEICDAAVIDGLAGPVPLPPVQGPPVSITLPGSTSVGRLLVNTSTVQIGLADGSLSVGPFLSPPFQAPFEVGNYPGVEGVVDFTLQATSKRSSAFVFGDAHIGRPAGNLSIFRTVDLDFLINGDLEIGGEGEGAVDAQSGFFTVATPDKGAAGRVIVGGAGEGVLSADNGAVLSFDLGQEPGSRFVIADEPGSVGRVTTGAGEFELSASELIIGNEGSGVLHLGSSFFTDAQISVAVGEASSGQVFIDAGDVFDAGGAVIGEGEARFLLLAGDATLDIGFGFEGTPNTLIAGDGDVVGLSSYTVTNPGVTRPAALSFQGDPVGPGSLFIGDAFSMVGPGPDDEPVTGRLEIRVEGDEPGEFSTLNVSTFASLGGQLAVDFGGATPLLQIGRQMPVVNALTFDGSRFEAAVFPALPAGLFLALAYSEAVPSGGGESQAIVVVGALDGDIDFDPDELIFPGGANPAGAVLADLGVPGDARPDGFVDLAITLPDLAAPEIAPGALLVLYNEGVDVDGGWLGFGGSLLLATGPNPQDVEAADLDGDGFTDLAIAQAGSGEVLIFLNDGSGLINADSFLFPTDGSPFGLVITDVDNDRAPDIVTASPDTATLSVLVNTPGAEGGQGGVSFPLVETVSLPEGAAPISVNAADFDGDGAIDLVSVNEGDDTISIILGDGPNIGLGGGFGTPDPIPLAGGASPGSVEPGDLDNDKDVDIIVVEVGNDSAGVIVNGRDGKQEANFEPPTSVPVGMNPSSAALVDLGEDPDGQDLDLAVVVEDETTGERVVQIFRNDLENGQINYAPAATVDPGADGQFILAGDVDNDGDADLVSVDQTTPAPQAAYAGPAGVTVFLGAPIEGFPGCVADFDGDGVINSDDLNMVLQFFGCEGGCEADADMDGDVDGDDLNIILALFGFTCD